MVGGGVSMLSPGPPPSLHLNVFTNLETNQISCSRVFIELNLQLSLPFLEVSGWGWKFQPSNHLVFLVTGLALSHFISINSGWIKRSSLWLTKSTLSITQEIPRVSGALCQEPGINAKYILYYITTAKCAESISFDLDELGVIMLPPVQ